MTLHFSAVGSSTLQSKKSVVAFVFSIAIAVAVAVVFFSFVHMLFGFITLHALPVLQPLKAVVAIYFDNIHWPAACVVATAVL